MTKLRTIRWNFVPSKNPLFASWTSEAVAQGDCSGSSSIVNEPLLVVMTSSCFSAVSSGFRSGTSLPPSLVTSQAELLLLLPSSPPPPQPASAASAASSSTRTSGRTAIGGGC
jgi:hypothetical protein